MVPARGVGWLQPSPALGLDRDDRRRILRAVRQGERLPGRDGELARDTAERIVRQRWVVVLIPVAALVVVLSAARNGLDGFEVLVLLAAVVATLALPFAWRDVRRARRYLALEDQPSP